MRGRRVPGRLLLVLVAVAAASRLTLQVLVMPPYAGLDELFHIARLAFVSQEHRHPSFHENSVPRYLERSAAGSLDAPPAFGLLGTHWSALLGSRPLPWPDPVIEPAQARTYESPNYEAQQPSLYYTLSAPLLRILPRRTAENELMLWRSLSVLCAIGIVMATALLASRRLGAAGFLAALLLCATPTWLTLVARASNDALACGLVACGLLLSSRIERRPARWGPEGLVWAAAIAVKPYTWAALPILPFLWGRDRRASRRALVVFSCSLLAGGLTMTDLWLRTGHPFGEQSFSVAAGQAASGGPGIDYGAMARVFVASALWPGAQHGNALTPLGMLCYAGPLLGLLGAGLVLADASLRRRFLPIVTVSLAALLFAQIVHGYGFVRRAKAASVAMPAGGMEGWYLFSGAALLFGLGVTLALRGLTRRPALLVCVVLVWLFWDVVIHEGGLFRDYAGLTTAAIRGVLLRWGSLPGAPHDELGRLMVVGSGHPAPPLFIALRAIHLLATGAVVVGVLSRRGRRDAALEDQEPPVRATRGS